MSTSLFQRETRRQGEPRPISDEVTVEIFSRKENFSRVVMVAHEYSPFPGGMATYAKEMTCALAKCGVNVDVLAPRYPDDKPPPETGIHEWRGLRHHRLLPQTLLRALKKLFAVSDGAFLHAVDVRSAAILWLFKLITGRKYGVTIHGSEVSKLAAGGIARALTASAFRSADIIFANSTATRDLFLRNLPCSVPVRVTHLGVDRYWFTHPSDGFENAELAALEGSARFISSVGRIEERKGHRLALTALKLLQERNQTVDVVYIVAGKVIEASYVDALTRVAKTSGIRLLVTGPLSRDDLRRLYQKSACHVLSAVSVVDKIEGFGLVVLEAAAQGCPTVATRLGGIPETIRDGETGFLCSDGDADAIAESVGRLLNEPALRQRLSSACVSHARTFSWDKCMRKTYEGIIFVSPSMSEGVSL